MPNIKSDGKNSDQKIKGQKKEKKKKNRFSFKKCFPAIKGDAFVQDLVLSKNKATKFLWKLLIPNFESKSSLYLGLPDVMVQSRYQRKASPE